MPWLPAIPPGLREHADWGSYLDTRAHRVTDLGHQVHRDSATWTHRDAPSWATGLGADADTELRGDIAVWRAAHGIPTSDDRPTGPPQPGTDAGTHQRHLDSRLRHTDAGQDTPAAGGWTMLPEAVRSDPYVQNLERRLTTLHNAGADPAQLIDDALAEPRPLPVEHPAAALWWRITRRVDPAALRTAESPAAAEDHRQSAQTRWTAQLTEAAPASTRTPAGPSCSTR